MGQQITHEKRSGVDPKTNQDAMPYQATPQTPKSENRQIAVVFSRHGTGLRAGESSRATKTIDERLRTQRKQGTPPPSSPNREPSGGDLRCCNYALH